MDVHYRDEGDQNDSIPTSYWSTVPQQVCILMMLSGTLKATNRVIRMDLPAYGLTGPFLTGTIQFNTIPNL
jgi:hypothetical protein